MAGQHRAVVFMLVSAAAFAAMADGGRTCCNRLAGDLVARWSIERPQ